MAFKNSFFDRILAVDSFHHWNNQFQALLEIKRVLKSDGIFLLVEFDPTTRLGHFIRSGERALKMGSNFFTPNQIREMYRKVKLLVKKQFYIVPGTFVTISTKKKP